MATTVSPDLNFSKRKASTAGLSSAGSRPVKRRASKACCCCRARKVRCDVVESGSPCTNCRLDQVECVVTESKRRKYACPIQQKEKVTLLNANVNVLRKSRAEQDNSINVNNSDNDTDLVDGFLMHDENGSLCDAPTHGLPALSPPATSRQGQQHMPHVLGSYFCLFSL